MKIETSHDGYQYIATTSNYDGPGSPIGISRTSETEAVADLKEQMAEIAIETTADTITIESEHAEPEDPEWWPEIAERDFARRIYEQCEAEDARRDRTDFFMKVHAIESRLPRSATQHLRASSEEEMEGLEGTGENGDE